MLTAGTLRTPVRPGDDAVVDEEEEMQLARYGTVSPSPELPYHQIYRSH